MKKIFFSLFLSLLVLAGCGSDPVQDELVSYFNEDMAGLADQEEKVIATYESVTGDNYTDDEALYDKLNNEIIPEYRDFINKLEAIEIESEELSDVHEIYVDAANTQYNAFVKMLDAIEKQDTGIISEANAMLDDARSKMREYQKQVEKLAEEHNVVFEDEE